MQVWSAVWFTVLPGPQLGPKVVLAAVQRFDSPCQQLSVLVP